MLSRLITRARRLRRGPSPEIDPSLAALNIGFVLHERTDSDAVRSMTLRATKHASWVASQSSLDWLVPGTVGIDQLTDLSPELILSATIGLPRLLAGLLAANSTQPALLMVDAPANGITDATFFRATAHLRLPGISTDRLVVAAVVLRPGGKTADLVTHGPYSWPDERETALQALEDLIRAHVSQWIPTRALWDAPAETLLPPGEFE